MSAAAGRAQTPASDTREWVWANGNATETNSSVFGVYGILGVASPANTPPGRDYPTSWTDSAGNFWLFGGSFDLNDLWKFDPSNAEWTWISGAANLTAVSGTYGQLGVASPGNIPGVREGSAGWVDRAGNLWLFGGFGAAALGQFYLLNDLWKFDSATAEWTWMGGNNTVPANPQQCLTASYGALGVAAATNLPVGRSYAAAWTDTSGDFWLFGGAGCNASSGQVLLNDLWRYSPSTGEWTWMGGSSAGFAGGTYGTLGVESGASVPGSRQQAASWTDAAGDFWLFGGEGLDSARTRGFLNDLWRFDVSTQQWAWMSGSVTIGTQNCTEDAFECARSSVYGVLGQAAPGNVPGGRLGSVGAALPNNNFLLFGGMNLATQINNTFNDLWQFNAAAAQWAWIGGSDSAACGALNPEGGCEANGEVGIYGTKGTPAVSNYPGSRQGLASWADSAGDFWIFGGSGFDSREFDPILNDIWQYGRSPSVTPPSTTTVTVTSSANPVFTQNPIIIAAHVSSAAMPPNSPTGTINFSETVLMTGLSVSLGSATVDASGNATLSVASLPAGTYTIEASYGGDASDLAATGSVTELVGDFSLDNAPAKATVASGGTAVFNLTLTPLVPISTLPAAIMLTASGGPAGAVYAFAPASISPGSTVANATLSIRMPQPAASHLRWLGVPTIPLALAGLLWPFVRRAGSRGSERPARRASSALFLVLLAGFGSALALGGCGNNFYTGVPPAAPNPPTPNPQTYTITIVGSSGPLSHSATVTLVVN